MADQGLLRQIPKVDELLSHPGLEGESSHTAALHAVREVLCELRESVLRGECGAVPAADDLADMILERIRRGERPNLRRAVNATGVILHTNLGRAPLAASAIESVCAAAGGYSTLEYDPEEGTRGSRHDHVSGLLTRLTGAEDAIAVNNNAAAVMLMLAAVADGREIIVSRGELVEIGGSFRIPEVMEQSGCTLREVGTTNRTHTRDYENAIIPEQTGALLKVHTSNYKIIGFTQGVCAEELAALGGKYGIPFLYDLGSGPMIPLTAFGVPDEPSVRECVAMGADMVCFSGDKLLGGPQAGIAVGKREYIQRMKAHPLARALRIDKLSLAALEATLRLCLDPETAVREIPALRMLAAPCEELYTAAKRITTLIGNADAKLEIIDDEGQMGGATAPAFGLPSVVLAVSPRNISAAELERRLRGCEPPIIARIAKDKLLIDPRTVDESDYEYVAGRVAEALK